MIGVVKDGKVISKSIANTRHADMAAAANALDEAGKLKQGCSVYTVIKEDGKLTVLGSQNFGGVLNVSDETIKAVLDEFE